MQPNLTLTDKYTPFHLPNYNHIKSVLWWPLYRQGSEVRVDEEASASEVSPVFLSLHHSCILV